GNPYTFARKFATPSGNTRHGLRSSTKSVPASVQSGALTALFRFGGGLSPGLVLVNLVLNFSYADSEHVGRLAGRPAGCLQRLQDRVAFDVVQRGAGDPDRLERLPFCQSF